jgi:DNA primase
VENKSLQLEKVLNYYNIPVTSSKFKMLCPFHEDKNESLLIDLEQGRWWCFGCQSGTEAKDFIKKTENIDDFEAYKLLYKILKDSSIKGKFEYVQVSPKEMKKKQKQYLIEAKDYYFNLKTIDWEKDYDYIQKEKQYLQDRGFSLDSLNKAKCKVTFNTSYPVIFPMNDMGKFKGYVCRTMDLKIQEKRKYLYNKGFSRRNTIVGKYDCSTVMIVEGYMDYLKAKQLGVKYVGALLGWKITSEQVQKLKDQGVTTIISALDNDKCGKKGTIVLKQYFNVIRFQYPKNIKDIGEMNIKQFEKAKQKTVNLRRKMK